MTDNEAYAPEVRSEEIAEMKYTEAICAALPNQQKAKVSIFEKSELITGKSFKHLTTFVKRSEVVKKILQFSVGELAPF